MRKYLDVTMPDGSVWRVPALAVAKNRAKHYGERDLDEYARELEYTLADDGELTEWARNNMNWEDVAVEARRITQEPQPVDYQEGWVNGPMRVVEVE